MTPQETAVTLNLIPGLGPVRIMRLMRTFASPELVLEAPAAMLAAVPGIGPELPVHLLMEKHRQPAPGTGTGGQGGAFP